MNVWLNYPIWPTKFIRKDRFSFFLFCPFFLLLALLPTKNIFLPFNQFFIFYCIFTVILLILKLWNLRLLVFFFVVWSINIIRAIVFPFISFLLLWFVFSLSIFTNLFPQVVSSCHWMLYLFFLFLSQGCERPIYFCFFNLLMKLIELHKWVVLKFFFTLNSLVNLLRKFD